MDLTGISHFFGLVTGFTYARWAEIFLETGWEGASLHSGGKVDISDGSGNTQTYSPNLDITGRNGFRAALNLAIHFGYDAVIGQNMGAELGNQLSILSFRYK
jgi:hypothetical protein